jgi:multiple sugar transport system permease protein
MINRRAAERIRVIVTYTLATLLTLVLLFPILWTISGSLKTAGQFSAYPPVWLPNPIAWINYLRVWEVVSFALYFFNSLVVTVAVLLGRLVVSSLVAYGFSRFRFPGRDLLFLLMLSMIMLPQVVTLVPEFLIFKQLGWNDTLLPLFVPAILGVGTGGAFTIFAFRQYFMSIPMDFDEAARIDGAGPLRIYWEILVPLSRPAFAAVAIFNFLLTWNDYLRPLVYLSSKQNWTVPLGLTYFQNQSQFAPVEPMFNLLMAAVVITSLPIILLFIAAQDHFVRGLALGGVKG